MEHENKFHAQKIEKYSCNPPAVVISVNVVEVATLVVERVVGAVVVTVVVVATVVVGGLQF